MINAVPGGHPPQDVLADLAAEVLSVDQARDVEAHVMRCRECEQVLVNAERVRALIAGPRPGPMPADVWAMIESSLTAEAAGRGHGYGDQNYGGQSYGGQSYDDQGFGGPGTPGQAGPATGGWFDVTAPASPAPPPLPPPAAQPYPAPHSPMAPPSPMAPMAPPPMAPPVPPAPALPAASPAPPALPAPSRPVTPPGPPPPYTASPVSVPGDAAAPDTGSMFLPKDGAVAVPLPPPDLSFDEAPTAAWRLFLNEEEPEPPDEPVQRKMGRAVRSSRSRRDVRTENEKVPRWRRPGVLAGAAAAGIVAVALGGLGFVTLMSGDDRDGLRAADALPGSTSRGILRSSGVEYTASTLVAQVKALMKNSSPVAATGSGAKGTPAASGSKGPAAPTTARPASPSPGAVTTPTVKPGTVADPKQLQSCLAALGESQRKPLLVDLARYQGREAAVIVLPGVNGGYDVWVVARDCRPGAEGHLAYKSVPG